MQQPITAATNLFLFWQEPENAKKKGHPPEEDVPAKVRGYLRIQWIRPEIHQEVGAGSNRRYMRIYTWKLSFSISIGCRFPPPPPQEVFCIVRKALEKAKKKGIKQDLLHTEAR